ncbi:tetratricopeptide repeat (TPR)-like superfamily protein [Tasmannia lanceolata]|uniref:tetratricopeptide repeat (TPR)-like superfamily protein n=1 Tax=Tasmannia lanceolata TaxID=3420 RepID=UPI0040649062
MAAIPPRSFLSTRRLLFIYRSLSPFSTSAKTRAIPFLPKPYNNNNNRRRSCSLSSPTHHHPIFRTFSSKSNNTNSPIAFDYSDSDDEHEKEKEKEKEIDKTKLPPPYDPFSKRAVMEEPDDPKNLQEIFHKMRTEGLTTNAIKMFDALSKDGLTHQALDLFAQIKDKGNMPDVVAHTAVIEAYANAGGQSKEALKVYTRMLASGVNPNAYTYTVLIKGLARDSRFGDAKKYVMEMMDKRIRPNAATYTALFEAFAREQKLDEGRELLEQMKARGFVPDEKAVREHLIKRGQVYRGVINLLFGK